MHDLADYFVDKALRWRQECMNQIGSQSINEDVRIVGNSTSYCMAWRRLNTRVLWTMSFDLFRKYAQTPGYCDMFMPLIWKRGP